MPRLLFVNASRSYSWSQQTRLARVRPPASAQSPRSWRLLRRCGRRSWPGAARSRLRSRITDASDPSVGYVVSVGPTSSWSREVSRQACYSSA